MSYSGKHLQHQRHHRQQQHNTTSTRYPFIKHNSITHFMYITLYHPDAPLPPPPCFPLRQYRTSCRRLRYSRRCSGSEPTCCGRLSSCSAFWWASGSSPTRTHSPLTCTSSSWASRSLRCVLNTNKCTWKGGQLVCLEGEEHRKLEVV